VLNEGETKQRTRQRCQRLRGYAALEAKAAKVVAQLLLLDSRKPLLHHRMTSERVFKWPGGRGRQPAHHTTPLSNFTQPPWPVLTGTPSRARAPWPVGPGVPTEQLRSCLVTCM
jgi:hypothetical protein